ncbi:hypothetical protein OESDEN_18385 [Oesophagostomum dentatum]|uniref:Uncharacterized protein n=1 Tax=Oesophagostomum dentatum TaxID=61180 RepID=A0A0B1SDE8_OESDE|nr:hypothetical protein OESDEN_18385 [Oesophagostomum dentatum]
MFWAYYLTTRMIVARRSACLRIVATVLSVYSQPRVLAADCIKSVQARCMTKFGPGSSLLESLDEWERSGQNVFYKVPSNAYHLAPPPLLYQKHENGRIIQSSPEEQVRRN